MVHGGQVVTLVVQHTVPHILHTDLPPGQLPHSLQQDVVEGRGGAVLTSSLLEARPLQVVGQPPVPGYLGQRESLAGLHHQQSPQ